MSDIKRYAIVDGEQVVNVIYWDGLEPYNTSGNLILLEDDSPVSWDWAYVNGEFVEPERPIEPGNLFYQEQ